VSTSSRIARGSRHSSRSDIGPSEVIADEEERLVGYAGARIGHAVPEVESGWVSSLAIAIKRFDSDLPVALFEGNDLNPSFFQEMHDEVVASLLIKAKLSDCISNRLFFSRNASRTAPVFVSPVISATSAANFSVSVSSMFRAMAGSV
jgi:hypothetical protein